MEWVRKGLIYKPEPKYEWSQSHAQVPFAFPINENLIRFYFATRDSMGRSNVSFIETDAKFNLLQESKSPLLKPGILGSFDDSGTMPSWFVKHNDKVYMYYTAWNLGGTISYRLSIGLAISEDNGLTFKKLYDAPILDRSPYDISWVAQPSVMYIDGIWKMWYLSCTKWEIINGHPEPFYHVKYAESPDGIFWKREGIISVDYDAFTDAIGRPSIIFEDKTYKMFYSYRNAKNYRSDSKQSYRLGFAESKDGKSFKRKDELIKLIGEREEWEQTMNAYGHVESINGQKMIFYNGNGFGKSGFGYAVLK